MALFTTATLDRFNTEGLQEFSQKHPFLVKRASITSVNGTKNYSLDSNILAIRRVTWKGKRLDPLPQRFVQDDNISQTAKGTPLFYVFNNATFPSLDFYPIPNEAITAGTTDLWGSDIASKIIYEYYALPETSTIIIVPRSTIAGDDRVTTAGDNRDVNVSEFLPVFLNNRTLDVHTKLRRAEIETKAQDKNAEDYFSGRWEFLITWNGILLDDLLTAPGRIRDGGTVRYINKIPTPRLPSTFGVGVDR